MGSSAFYRWGVAIARHRRVVLTVSVLVLVLCMALVPVLQRELGPPSYGIDGTDSQRVERLLEHGFGNLGSENDALVFYSLHHIASDKTYRGEIAKALSMIRRQAGVRSVFGPFNENAVGQISSDEHVAVAGISLSGDVRERFDRASGMQSAVRRADAGGVQMWLTGYSPIAQDIKSVTNTDVARAAAIGIPLVALILLLALGGVVAAAIPLLMAGVGLLLTDGALTLLATMFNFESSLLAIATMIGLGIGLDYAMFIVSRFREELARTELGDRSESERVAEALGVTVATTGRTVFFSGVIVMFSLASLLVIPVPFLREFPLAAAVVVICTLSAALIVLPALLALLGSRIDRLALPGRLRPAHIRPRAGRKQSGWARWALAVMRHPILAIVVVVPLLLAAAAPVFGMHYGVNLGVLSLTDTPSGKGEQLLSDALTPGAVSPVQVVVSARGHVRPRADIAAAKQLIAGLETDPRVTGVLERRQANGVLLVVVPSVRIDSRPATALVEHIRRDLAPRIAAAHGASIMVGGDTALISDLASAIRRRFPLVLALILGMSLLLLMVIFRSIVLPLKAVAMNLLATGATVGLVVLVFQHGYGAHLLGFTSPGFIQAYVPILVFALLFGLSMDYEVFLIRRMQEEWEKSGDNQLAIVTGVKHTARPITAAAAIMVVIFGSFVTTDLLELKQLGFAAATAIALDATLIRFVLVPATMRLFGARNWWLPAPLARALPGDIGLDTP